MRFDRIIRNGTIVTASATRKGDIGIKGERIAAIAESLPPGEADVIDARGSIVMPGVLDVHVHLDLPVAGTVTADDYLSGTRAAARGGVTTVIDFATPYARPDGTYESLSEAADLWLKKAEGKALIDYTFHIAVTNYRQHRKEIPSLVRRGFSTFKEYMIYKGIESDDGTIFETLEQMRELHAMLLVHAESPSILDALIARNHTPELMKRHKAKLHPMTRPNVVEYEAIQRCIAWSRETRGQLYIVHVSTQEGADLIRRARHEGVPVLGETCTHFLVLDESVFSKKDGHLFATCPQVKTEKDQDRLWKAIHDGDLSVISTDNCSFTKEQKGAWNGDWTRIPMGLPGIETLLPLVYTHGVLAGRLSLEQMVDRLCTAPARIMGLHPRKGCIEIGADADLAIFDPTVRTKVDWRKMESRCDYSPYQGMELAGVPHTTISRGEVVVSDYRITGKAGRGNWLPRKHAGLSH
jgi:dihydropyrimidinase